MIFAPTNRRVIRPYDKPSFEHTQRYGLIRGHWANRNRVGLWLFNEGSGNKVFDLSGNGNVGTFQGTAPSWTAGKFGSAVLLPGTDEYINLGAADLFGNLNSFSLSIWFWVPSDVSGTQNLFTQRYGLSNAYTVNIYWYLPESTDLLRFVVKNSNDDFAYADATGVSKNAWHHLVGVYDGSECQIYIDSVAKDASPPSLTPPTKTGGLSTFIGAMASNTPTSFWDGKVDIFCPFNRALSASEIALLYREPFLGIEKRTAPVYFFVPTGEGEDYVRTINDSVELTDVESLIKEIYRTFDESMGVTDVDSKIWNSIRIVAESLGITDILTKEEVKVISESLGLTDAISRVSVILRTLAESLGIIDSVSDVWTAIRTFAESLGITDEIDAILENLQVIDDSIGLTDTTSRIHVVLRTLSESLGLTDAITSVFVISRIISDSEGITDGLALQRIMTVADTLGITDDVTRLIDYLRMEDDAIGLLDSMVRVSLALRTIDDDMGITDEVSAQLGALLKAVWAFVVMRQTHS